MGFLQLDPLWGNANANANANKNEEITGEAMPKLTTPCENSDLTPHQDDLQGTLGNGEIKVYTRGEWGYRNAFWGEFQPLVIEAFARVLSIAFSRNHHELKPNDKVSIKHLKAWLEVCRIAQGDRMIILCTSSGALISSQAFIFGPSFVSETGLLSLWSDVSWNSNLL